MKNWCGTTTSPGDRGPCTQVTSEYKNSDGSPGYLKVKQTLNIDEQIQDTLSFGVGNDGSNSFTFDDRNDVDIHICQGRYKIERTSQGHPLRVVTEADCQDKGCKSGESDTGAAYSSLPTSSLPRLWLQWCQQPGQLPPVLPAVLLAERGVAARVALVFLASIAEVTLRRKRQSHAYASFLRAVLASGL